MKYKNRLIIPTLVSTSLLASTMVANAEEVDQNEQYSGQSTEEYAVNDETSEKELDFIESEEASEEATEDEKSEDDSEEKESEEADEETDELEDLEETESAEAEEVVENELDENNIEEMAETPAEIVEEPGENEQSAEAPVDETEADETAEEVTEEAPLESQEQEVETEVAEPAEEVVTEESVEISEEVEESAEQLAESEQSTGTSVEVTDEPVEAEEPEVTAPAEAVDENAVDEMETEEVTTESVEKTAESEQNSAANNKEDTIAESDEASVETVEAEVEETESPQSDEATYKYNFESMEQELQNLSEDEQTAFLEENADNIEVDEEMLNSLAEGLAAENEELNAEEIAAATASTMSTMTLSEAITDINQYIADNNFEVAEIQYDYIPGLPEYAYHSNYGREPENGEVGKPKGVVLHDVGNDNSTIHGEISYMSRNWENAFVHAFVDADNIIQVADTDYLAYGAGPYSNDLHMHVELVRHDNAHDFAKSINNYADYIANLLYKYKLPVVNAEETGEGTLFSHVAVSNHLGGTASPDPYEYFARFDYEYNDVINLITNRYNDMYNKNTAPQISMPIEQGTTDLLAEVNTNNSGLYESVTDVRTKNANDLLGQQFRVVRTATYNYDDYYLLEDENGVSLGWMYAGDLTTSEYVPEVENDEDLKEPKPEAPEVPTEPELEESDDTADEEQAPEEEQPQDEEDINTGVEEGSDEELDDSTGEEQSDEQPAEPANPETPEEADQPEDNTPENTNETDDSTEESTEESADNGNQEEPANTDTSESADDVEDESDNQAEENNNEETDDSDQESTEQEAEVSDDNAENAEDANQDSEENEEPTVSETTEDGEVSSSLVDSATGVRVVSATDELDGKSIVVTVMNPSNAIGAAHDLYDIHILDENGSLYSLNNPVTVYLPANGYVSNVYYLGDIGETLEAVNYTTADGYAVFEVNSFSQYAVVYGNENEDNTTIAPVTGNQGTGGEDMAADQTNEHPTVYTEKDVNSEDEAAADASSNNANQDGSGAAKETEEAEMLPDTGVAEQSTTVFAAILAALGLGFLVKRRKTTEK